MNKAAQDKIDRFFDECQRNIDSLSPEKVKEKQSRYLDEEKINYFSLKLEQFLSDNPNFSKQFMKADDNNSDPDDNCIYFHKLRTHIIGAYGKFELLKPYYEKNKWKFKVSDLITLDGINLGPGCIFSLKHSASLLHLMERDGWDITEIAALVNSMKAFVKEQVKLRNAEKRRKKREESKQKEENKSTIKFQYIADDQFVIYGDELKIEETLDKLSFKKDKILLNSIGIEEQEYTEGFIINYRHLLPFIKKLGGDWDVANVREWALGYSLKIVNPERGASEDIKTTQDIDRFFEWCYQNQKIIYVGTLHQKYQSLIDNGRLKYFLFGLSKFFAYAKEISPECKTWFKKYIPALGQKGRNTIGGHEPRARIIYPPMGGLNKRR